MRALVLTVHRELGREHFDFIPHGLKVGFIVGVVEYIGNEVANLACLVFGKAPCRHGRAAQTNAAGDKRCFGVVWNGIFVHCLM